MIRNSVTLAVISVAGIVTLERAQVLQEEGQEAEGRRLQGQHVLSALIVSHRAQQHELGKMLD